MALLAGIAAAASLLLVLVCWASYHLLVQQGKLILRVENLETNLRQQGIAVEPQPELALGQPSGFVLNNFELPELSGGAMTLWQFRGRRVLLVYLNPACPHSRAMLPHLAKLAAEAQPDWPEMVIVSTGDPEENRRLFAAYQIRYPILLQEGLEVADLHRVPGTPMGYLLDERGVTQGKLLTGKDALLAAARLQTPLPQAAAMPPRVGRDYSRFIRQPYREGLAAGAPAPDFSLPQLDGSELALQSFRGRKVLLVFSDPGCAPCTGLALKLEEIHNRRGDAGVLMVSRGDLEENRRWTSTHRITFPLVLQQQWEISRAYFIFATPAAYLIGEQGLIITDALVGSDAILEAISGGNTSAIAPAKTFASR